MTLATYFEWRVPAGEEEAFVQLWTDTTLELRSHGSFGSALFRDDEGLYCAFARWPDLETRDCAFAAHDQKSSAPSFAALAVVAVTRKDMDEIANYWTSP